MAQFYHETWRFQLSLVRWSPCQLANIFENLASGVLLLGLFQFPLYGALLFMGTLRSAIVLGALLVLHVLAVIACFAPLLDFIFY